MVSLPKIKGHIERLRQLTQQLSHSATVLTASATLDRELKSLIITGLGKNPHDQILAIADIRNDFAHPDEEYTLDAEPIAEKFRKLKIPPDTIGHRGELFLACVKELTDEFARPKKKYLRKRKPPSVGASSQL
jgi:hypothetical protein